MANTVQIEQVNVLLLKTYIIVMAQFFSVCFTQFGHEALIAGSLRDQCVIMELF